MTMSIRQTSWRKCFIVLVILALVIYASHQIRLNELSKVDAIAQLEFRVDSLRKQLSRLEDVIAIQGYSRNPLKDSASALRQQGLVRDFLWLRFLRLCADRKTFRLLLLEESLVRGVDATASSSLSVVSTETLLKNFTHVSILDKDVSAFVDVILAYQSIPSSVTSSPSSSPPPFPVDLIFADAKKGVIEKIPLTNSSASFARPAKSPARTVFGFSFFDGTSSRVKVSVLYEKRNSVVDAAYEGYYFLPWSWTGFPRAFPRFTTKNVDVDGFVADNGLFQTPSNTSHFLWESAAAEFLPCDGVRTAAFAKKCLKPTKLDPAKDKARIKSEMSLITGLQRSMAVWEKRNWIFAGTLLGWYRQCSLIPHDLDMDTASWIHDFEDWMIEHYRQHPLLKMYVKFGLKDDSLEFKMGNKRKRTIDLFWMYPGPAKNQSWLGIQTFDGKYTKKVSFYPEITRICTADLHGYLVYVPCDTWSIIKMEYGEKHWFEPNPKYDYKKDAFNWRINGTWTAKQWKGGAVYKVFQ